MKDPRLYHPLPESAPIGCDDLLSRCDAGAARVIAAARALAEQRIEQEEHLFAWPFAGPRTLHRAATERGLSRTDLLRAVLAREPEALREGAFGERADDRVDERRFAEAVARWGSAVDLARGDSVKAIERGWSRRVRMILHANPDLTIDLPWLLSLLLDARCLEAIAAFSRDYVEGFCLIEEAADVVREHLTDHLFGYVTGWHLCGEKYVLNVPTWYEDRAGRLRAAEVPAVFLDRHGGLGDLDAALTAHGAVVVVSEHPGHGRRALAEAWISRLRFEGRPPGLSALHCGNLDATPYVPADEETLEQNGVIEGSCYFLTPTPSRGGRARVGTFTPELLEAELQRAAAHPEELRAIFVVSRAEHELLCRRVAGFADLPCVRVPAVADRDLLVLWVCKAPQLEDLVGGYVGVGSVVRAFIESSDEQRRALDTAAVVEALRRSRARPWPSRPPTVPLGWHRISELAKRRRLFDDPSTASADQDFIDRFIGDTSRYELLVALAEWLRPAAIDVA